LAKIYIDKKEYNADPSKNLLETCLSLGFDLPYFCWHPAMDSVGACRQCAVKKYKDKNDEKGKLVMSCLEAVQDGARISIYDKEAVEFRASVIEWLMTNHPHDCPVCDEGGECHLQDMTVMTGHSYRRFNFPKRTHKNQYLGPFIYHEMNRCIQCYRCVRFYNDYAGGEDFGVFGAHDNVYFGREEEGVLENEFSGNLVEVCPTGVFTDKTLRKHYTRKWDMTGAPSICTHCGVGCNIIAAERYGSLRRILSRYNGEVNGYFLCDRGRFGYEFVNSEKRITEPSINNESTDVENASGHIAGIISNSKKVVGIGSPRASLESNYVLQKLVGKENFYSGVSSSDQKILNEILNILGNSPAHTPSLKEIEKADAVLILGEDLTNTAPMMALATRQSIKNKPMKIVDALKIPEWHDYAVRDAIQDDKSPFYVFTPFPTKLDRLAAHSYYASPDDIARAGFAIANQIDKSSPEISGDEKSNKLFSQIADDLLNAENPLIISGASCGSEALIHAAANIAWALCKKGKNANLSFAVPEANSMGLSILSEKSYTELYGNTEGTDTVVILENDLYRRDSKEKIDKILSGFKNIIVLDSIQTETTNKADVVIPSGTFSEADGTFVNNEGRAQRYYQVYLPENQNVVESWRYLDKILDKIEKKDSSGQKTFFNYVTELSSEIPELKEIKNITPPPDFRVAGQKVPREPHRFSGRTAMTANIDVSEPKPPVDIDSPLSFTMEGLRNEPPSPLIPFFWSPGWNSVQSINKFQIEVGGPLHGGDPGKRLFEPKENANIKYFSDIPEKFKKRENEYLAVPIFKIFGSEELSSFSSSIKERMQEPYVLINSKDAEKLKTEDGTVMQIKNETMNIKLKVKVNSSLPEGVVGLPAGFSGLEYTSMPAWIKIAGVEK
jgi:NADH-quinone oxidoreductase subunit G